MSRSGCSTNREAIGWRAETHLHSDCLRTLNLFPYMHASSLPLLFCGQEKHSTYPCLVVNSYQGVNPTEQRLYAKVIGLASLFWHCSLYQTKYLPGGSAVKNTSASTQKRAVVFLTLAATNPSGPQQTGKSSSNIVTAAFSCLKSEMSTRISFPVLEVMWQSSVSRRKR